MFVNAIDNRFAMRMWSDSRLVNKQGIFCLCTKCAKENEATGIECLVHKRFMQATRSLQVTAPVFACPDFKEDTTKFNVLSLLYNPNIEKIESSKAEKEFAFLDNFEAQMERWGMPKKEKPVEFYE